MWIWIVTEKTSGAVVGAFTYKHNMVRHLKKVGASPDNARIIRVKNCKVGSAVDDTDRVFREIAKDEQ